MFLWGSITIPVQMLIGGVIAYLIERYTHRSKTFFRVMFFLPVITSVSVVSIVWAQMYAPYYGIVQEYLKYLGVQLNIAPLGEPKTAIFALIIVNIWQWTGFSMIMYVAGLNNIPSDIFDAARIDGAHGLKLAVRIIVPLVSPVTRSLLLLGVIGTLQTFPIVYLMTDGGPDHASEVFGTYIFKQGFVIGDTGYSSALSTLVLAIALAPVDYSDRRVWCSTHADAEEPSVESGISQSFLAQNQGELLGEDLSERNACLLACS